MTFEEFAVTLKNNAKPANLAPALEALWVEASGDWARAHAIVQTENTTDAAWVHAYLHRKEGDRSNAAYWYASAGKPVNSGSLENEWEQIVRALLPGAG